MRFSLNLIALIHNRRCNYAHVFLRANQVPDTASSFIPTSVYTYEKIFPHNGYHLVDTLVFHFKQLQVKRECRTRLHKTGTPTRIKRSNPLVTGLSGVDCVDINACSPTDTPCMKETRSKRQTGIGFGSVQSLPESPQILSLRILPPEVQ